MPKTPDVERSLPGIDQPAVSKRSQIASFMVMDVMRAAAAKEAEGQSVIHMEVGQPATPAPRAAILAAKAAMERNSLGYTLALGNDSLRERIARHYKDTYGLAIQPERVVVTTGSSGGFVLTFLALFEAGARVALPSPGYPCYRNILTALGHSPLIIETGSATRWMPDLNELARLASQTGLDGFLLASPANPTGTMANPELLRSVADFCSASGAWLISDEIYHGLTYGTAAQTALAFSDQAIVVNSFSKYFSMTGWRIGWLIVPDGLQQVFERLAQNLYISPPAISQIAAVSAFDGIEELEANRRTYATNRELLLEGLTRSGFHDIAPADGAFYLYADVSTLTDDSISFARNMLDETGIAVTPGVDFDQDRGNRFIRFCYAGRTDEVAEAVKRLRGWQRLKAVR